LISDRCVENINCEAKLRASKNVKVLCDQAHIYQVDCLGTKRTGLMGWETR
jgi:hypothetical protein